MTECGATIPFPMSSEHADQTLLPLLAAAKVSGFGHGGETKVDTAVRVASELTPDQFTVDFDPEAHGILGLVKAALVPEAGGVRAELHKMNVMGRGGFFKKHKDTPRGASTCFGTLVVSLPAPFTGENVP
jgi:hypothetical protein